MSRSRVILAIAAAAAAAATAVVPGCGAGESQAGRAPGAASRARVTSSIAEGAELRGAVRWQARVAGVPADDVVAVRFLIDGAVRYLARHAPYVFGGRGSLLLPATLGPGSHVFAVDATLAGGYRLTAAVTAIVPAATASGTAQQLLDRRIHPLIPGAPRKPRTHVH